MKKHRLILMVLVAFLSVAALVAMNRQSEAQDNNQQSNNQDEHTAIRDALRRGGLREAARLKKHYVGDFEAHWDFSSLDAESLVKKSAVVVIGAPFEKLGSHLTAGGQVIVSDYAVAIQEVIKGESFQASTITVSLPGGRVEFEDGTSAELRTPTFEHVKLGRVYAFFLDESARGPNIYTLTGGPQGLAEFVENSRVKSHGRSTDPIAREKNGTDKRDFLRELHEYSKKWPHKGKCCGGRK